MGNETQGKQQGEAGTGRRRTGYRYGNSNTTNKSSFKRNILELEDAVFTQGVKLTILYSFCVGHNPMRL